MGDVSDDKTFAKLPGTAVLEMTYRCNHRCVFCSCPWFASRFERLPELDVEGWRRVIDRLVQFGVGDLAFTGGEPLLKDGLFEIMAHAAGSGVRLHLLSNGRAMSDDVLRFCREHDVQLSMSLPGLETFGEHTGSDTPVDSVLRWFEKAKGLGISTVAGVTVTNRNLSELFETLAEALLHGADFILLNRFMPGGRGLRHRDWELDRGQLAEMLAVAEEVLRTADRFGSVGTELPYCLIDPAKFRHLKVGTRCSAAIGFFVVDPSGYVRACNHSERRLVFWERLHEIESHPYWRRFLDRDFLPDSCRECPSVDLCDGGCREAAHIVGGDLCSIDPLLQDEVAG